ncbi:MAG: hypothetical protein O6763_02960 [Gammaproteobacteria bacterium]|nr:hypothetical protein [Gammaproteobacteria bacterium]
MNIEKILCISVSGIGNTILLSPTLAELRRARPQARIDLLAWNPVEAESLSGSGLVNECYHLSGSVFHKLRLLHAFRRQRYDVSITAIPSNRWQFHLLPFLIGARMRVCHAYPFGKWRSLSWLSNNKVDAQDGLHDVENNLRLLRALHMDWRQVKPRLVFHIDRDSQDVAERWLREQGIGEEDRLVGVHAGASTGGRDKRWGLRNFAAELNAILSDDPGFKIVLLGGREEAAEREELKSLVNSKDIYIFVGPLKQTAHIIRKCTYFLSNDSGLMHIAAAFGIRQKAVFVATSITRTAPWNERAEVVDCTEGRLYPYPFHSCQP